jgi:serine phosphatase RsbU (regulator of sigma subunit)
VNVQVTTEQLNELLQDGCEVLTTVKDFGTAQIKRSSKGELTLLTVSGLYTPEIGKELERNAMQCRGNLGLEFKEMKVHAGKGRRFDNSILTILNRIRDRYVKRNRLFVLCRLPTELVDLLKLTGTYESYHTADRQAVGKFPSAKAKSDASTPAPDEVKKKIELFQGTIDRTIDLEKGLDSAAKCVQRFLPQEPPRVEGYDFAFSYQSSEKVGGDFFDFVPLGDDHLGISIGDVSGHGIDAALLMGISKKVVHIRALDAGSAASPRSVLAQANADLVSDFTRSAFVTVLYGILHLPTGELRYARAGHEPPIHFGPERGNVAVHETKGLPLGVDSGKIFNNVLEDGSLQLSEGGFVFFCTDGLAECWSPRGIKYSRKRLLFLLEQVDRSVSCPEALDMVLGSVAKFADGKPYVDDMTTILVKRQ